MARLQPTANWHQIMEEIATGGPPSTELGAAEQDWLASLDGLIQPLSA